VVVEAFTGRVLRVPFAVPVVPELFPDGKGAELLLFLAGVSKGVLQLKGVLGMSSLIRRLSDSK